MVVIFLRVCMQQFRCWTSEYWERNNEFRSLPNLRLATNRLLYFLDYTNEKNKNKNNKNGNNTLPFHLIKLLRDQSRIMYNTLKFEKCINIIIFTLLGITLGRFSF